MIWLALFTAYCFLCAIWSLFEVRERIDTRRTIRRRLGIIERKRRR